MVLIIFKKIYELWIIQRHISAYKRLRFTLRATFQQKTLRYDCEVD